MEEDYNLADLERIWGRRSSSGCNSFLVFRSSFTNVKGSSVSHSVMNKETFMHGRGLFLCL